MIVRAMRDAVSRIFYQRCVWPFAVLLVFIGAVIFVPASDHGRMLLNGINTFLLIAAVAAIGRTKLSLLVTLSFAVPAVLFHYLGLRYATTSRISYWTGNSIAFDSAIAILARTIASARVPSRESNPYAATAVTADVPANEPVAMTSPTATLSSDVVNIISTSVIMTSRLIKLAMVIYL